MRDHSPTFILLLLATLLTRCAQVAPLTGGARDTTPPALIEALPAEKSLSVFPEQIILRFDEYVQVKDLNNQFIVTPRMDPSPSVSADGKKIVVTIDRKALRPQTTYRLQFGNAIADMHESNALRNFTYVFSTGEAIDTLKISGVIRSALTATAETNVLVAAYEPADGDSAIFRQKPLYYARSGTDGTFHIDNLPPRPFFLYAIADLNKNEVYDGHTERIAFTPGPVMPGADSTIKMRMFQEEAAKGFIKSATSPVYGNGQIILNKRMRAALTVVQSGNAKIALDPSRRESDTIAFFYRDTRDTLRLAVTLENGKTDTTRLAVPRHAKRIAPRVTATAGRIIPGDKISITFNAWMDTSATDMRRVRLTSKTDTLIDTRPVTARWRWVNRLDFEARLQEGTMYALRLDSGAFRDVHGNTTDSSVTFFTAGKATDFGTLILHLRFDAGVDQIVQLLDAKNNVVRERSVRASAPAMNAATADFTFLPSGEYSVRVIADENANGKWDTGDVMKKLQPELSFVYPKRINVPVDWETEEDIEVKR